MRELDSKLNQKPQVNLARPTAVRMWLVCLCAGLAIIQSSWTDQLVSLGIASVALGLAILTELLILYYARNQDSGNSSGRITDGSAAASALVLTLLLPNTVHPVYAGLGAVFAMLVIKHSFGGLGSNWVNPALAGWLFVRFSWPLAFGKALEGSPLWNLPGSLKTGFFGPHGFVALTAGAGNTLDTAVSSFLNRTIFSLTGSELPGGYIDLLFSNTPGIIADRGLCALLLGTIVITASQVNRAWIPAVFLGVYALLIRAFGALASGGVLGEGDILFGLFSGGTMAAAFLLMADPATGAKSDIGMLAAVILGAVFTFIFRYPGGEPYGAFFAVALVNALIPLIRSLENHRLYSQKAGKGL
ncbi:hypothetical protein AGMMS49546_25680 [Spirochaetia bacterium]|nr:hypothetical protein AGMMS49546_25680 [Spirochaetia bacterium]